MIAFLGGRALASLLLLCADCSEETHSPEALIRSLPVDDLVGVVATEGVTFDPGISRDGNGSLRIEVSEATTLPIYEIREPELADSGPSYLAYRAALRTENVGGIAYLEIRARFPERGEGVFQAKQNPVGGTSPWSSHEALLFLRPPDAPEAVLLNLVVTGPGTVWIDEVSLARIES